MAGVENNKEMTTQGAEEHSIEISAPEHENQEAPNKEEAVDLTIKEGIFEKNEAIEKTIQQEEITGEEQLAEGNEGAQIAGEEELDLETRNENEDSEQNLSMETATALKESLREAVDSTDVEPKVQQSDRSPCAEELSNENKNESAAADQNQLRGSEGKGCREEIGEATAMKDIGRCAALEGTMAEGIQEPQDSQAQRAVDEEKTEGSVNTEEIQTGSQGVADTLVAEPVFKEDSDNTNEAPVSVSDGAKPEECSKEAECMAGQMELSAHTVTGNGSTTAITTASHTNGKSSEGDTLLKETEEEVAETHVCHDQEPLAGAETGPEATAETPETGLQTSVGSVEADLEIQPKGVEKIRATSAEGSEDTLVDIPPCLGNVTEYLEVSEGNRDPSAAERTTERPVSGGGNATEELAREDAEEQRPANDAGLSQDVQAAETMQSTDEQECNLSESVQATESPAAVFGESAGVSSPGLQQVSGSEGQGAPGDGQVTVAGEQ